jgi:hypothetical protein
MKLEFSGQILEKKNLNIKFHQNPTTGSREPSCSMWTDGLTDMTKLIVVFRNFANAPKQGA